MFIRSPLKYVGLCLIAVLPSSVWAQEGVTHAQTELVALLSRARAHNPVLLVKQGERAHAAAGLEGGSGWSNPSISFAASPAPVFTARGMQRYALRIEQDLPKPGGITLQTDRLVYRMDAADADVRVAALETDYAVRSGYVELARLDELIGLNQSYIEELAAFESVATTRYEVGEGSQQAILSIQLERNRIRLERVRLLNEREIVTNNLVALGAVSRADSPNLRARLPGWFRALSAGDLNAVASKGIRPEFDRFAAFREDRDAAVSQAKLERLPDMKIFATYSGIQDTDIPASADGRDAFAVGLSLRLPVWRKRIQARIHQTEQDKRLVNLQEEAFRVEIARNVATLQSSISSATDRLDLIQHQLLPQAEIVLEASINDYRNGRAGFLTLLDAYRSRFLLESNERNLLAGLDELMAQFFRETGLEASASLFQIDRQ